METTIPINIVSVIDCRKIIKDFPEPSTDFNKPTRLADDNPYAYMIVDSEHLTDPKTQATSHLSMKAKVGDEVHFRATSIGGNAYNAALLYKIERWDNPGNGQVFDPEGSRVGHNLVNSAHLDERSEPLGLPAIFSARSSTFIKRTVKNPEEELFWVYLAVYDWDGEKQRQELHGYFRWDPKVTVPNP